ncbi:WbuC family cupin fold metalloprotein [Candidatus Woesearchaeota archaeon]|nr:WbuC family cupin fold metalloprotein [Candidatus Woesearchaeota archaeon]
MLNLRKHNDEVFYAEEDVVKIGKEELDFLREKIKSAPNKRVRICAHSSPDDSVHEMIIMLDKNSYIRPHKHLGKTESFHIIEGSADIIIFDDKGKIAEIVQMGDSKSGKKFYYRLNKPLFHTLLINSEYLMLHETTNGPFKKGDSEMPEWAPDANDKEAAGKYVEGLMKEAKKFLAKKK